MSSPRLSIVLAAVLVVLLALVVVARPDLTQPNWEFLPEMKHSPAMHALEATPLFPNGRTHQTPVSGTIPRGQLPLHYAATKEDAVRAGEELLNPYQQRIDEREESAPAPDVEAAGAPAAPTALNAVPDPHAELAASVERGQSLFRVYCQSCHGASGAGDGPVAQRGFPPPPPLPTGKSAQMKDGQLFHILTYGQGSMDSMAAQLDRNQRWDAVNFVRSLQADAAAQVTALPTETLPSTESRQPEP